MKRLLAVLLFACLALPVQAAPKYIFEDEDAKVVFTDEVCQPPMSLMLEDEAKLVFYQFMFFSKSAVALQAAQGKKIVTGCWSDNYSYAPGGMFIFINEFGITGMVALQELTPVKQGVEVKGYYVY